LTCDVVLVLLAVEERVLCGHLDPAVVVEGLLDYGGFTYCLVLLRVLAFSSLDAGVSQKLAFPLRLKKHHSLLK
jgi:hypothetical protein